MAQIEAYSQSEPPATLFVTQLLLREGGMGRACPRTANWGQ